jgi:hypothetical protein
MPPRACLAALIALVMAGCADNSYTTPGGAADFSRLGLTPEAKAALTDDSVQQLMDKKPLVTFPATIAIVRVQATDYDSYSYHGYRPTVPQRGAYSVITVRDIEKDEDFDTIAHLPQVNGAVSLKRILLGNTLNSDLDLRDAAAKLHANLLLYYTLDTRFDTEQRVKPLSVISLGLFPNKMAKVTCTASAVLMDVNNGYIYNATEATAKNDQLANDWSSDQAVDDARHKAEREAFTDLLKQFKEEWPVVVATYNRPVPTAAAR